MALAYLLVYNPELRSAVLTYFLTCLPFEAPIRRTYLLMRLPRGSPIAAVLTYFLKTLSRPLLFLFVFVPNPVE